jgi:hypothetical protein
MDDVLVEVVLVVDVDGSLVRVVDDGGGSFVSLLLARDLGRKTDERRDLRVVFGSGAVVAILSSTDGEVKVGYLRSMNCAHVMMSKLRGEGGAEERPSRDADEV